MPEQSKFWNRPKPQKGPDIPYVNETSSNPVLRGWTLAPLGILIRSSTFLQSVLWKLNKFDKLKQLPHLDSYTPRYDPTVIPIFAGVDSHVSIRDLPRPQPRANTLQYYTCSDYHELYKSGKITPLQVAEYLISIISRPGKNRKPDRFAIAYIDTKAELVLIAARASTERYEKGQYLSVLDGVPVAVKDEIELQGYRKMQGSAIDVTGPYDQTGWCVRKWQEAGAVIIGKTNMHEFGMDTSGFNSTWGTPLNPHNEGYYTGGSSSGSACTVAHGVCPITLGADGGGSIRIPSSFCGVYGLKPSHNRISGRPTKAIANSVGVYGPIASSVDDLALAYRVMAQPDHEDGNNDRFPNSLTSDTVLTRTYPKVIGIDHAWIARSDPFVQSLFETALAHYTTKHGYVVVPISLPYIPESQKAHALTILNEAATDITSSQLPQLSYQNQVLLSAAASQTTAQDFLAAQRLRNMLMQHLAWLWDTYPGLLIVTPTTPCAGWKIGNLKDVEWKGYGASDSDMSLRSMEYIYVANWTGCPALTRPMGYTNEEGVPVGLMAMGEWGSEEQLLRWASEGEGLLGVEGTRTPKPEGHWIDVLEQARSH